MRPPPSPAVEGRGQILGLEMHHVFKIDSGRTRLREKFPTRNGRAFLILCMVLGRIG